MKAVTIEWEETPVEGRPDVEKWLAFVPVGEHMYELRAKYDPQSKTSVPYGPMWRWQVWRNRREKFFGGGAVLDQFSAQAQAEQRLNEILSDPDWTQNA